MVEKTDRLTRRETGYAEDEKRTAKTSPTIEDMDRTERAEIEHLRSEIARDRLEAEATIDAIRDRLTPAHLKSEAQEKIREVTIGKAQSMAHTAKYKAKDMGYSMYDTVKDNLVPTAMIGVGLAWLIKSRKDDSDDRDYYAYHPYLEEDYQAEDPLRYYTGPSADMRAYYAEGCGEHDERNASGARGARQKASDVAAHAREKVGSAGEKTGEMMDHARERVSSAGERTGEMISHARDRMGEQASHLGHRTRELSRQASRKSRRMANENPLAMAGALFAAGLAIGFMIPETRKEDEWMGETRDDLMEQAKEKSRETMDRVQDVAKESGKAAAETAKKEADKKGLTPDSESKDHTKSGFTGSQGIKTSTPTTGVRPVSGIEPEPAMKSPTGQPTRKKDELP